MRQIIKADSITCSWPKEVSGQTLVEIDYDSLTCDAESMASMGGTQGSSRALGATSLAARQVLEWEYLFGLTSEDLKVALGRKLKRQSQP